MIEILAPIALMLFGVIVLICAAVSIRGEVWRSRRLTRQYELRRLERWYAHEYDEPLWSCEWSPGKKR